MKFTVENQEENNISRTTKQTIKHFLYSNNEVIISGMDGSHSVWHKQGRRMSHKLPLLPNFISAYIERWATKRLPDTDYKATVTRQRLYIIPRSEDHTSELQSHSELV